MKNRRWIAGALVGMIFLHSCYEEEPIVTSGEEEMVLRYEFPQGNNAWDKDIVEIYENYGVCFIYKNFEIADFNRSWQGVMGSGYFGTDLKDEQVQFSVDFFKKHVFAYLNPKVMNRVFPPYYYMVYDHYNKFEFYGFVCHVPHKVAFGGLDFYMNCLEGEPDPMGLEEAIRCPVTPEEFRIRRVMVLQNLFRIAFERGTIVTLPGFHDGIDYKTEVKSKNADKNDSNYYITRGFPGRPMSIEGTNFTPLTEIKSITPNQNFIAYMQLTMRYTKAEYEQMYPSATYKLIHEKRQVVIDYMKQMYHVDLEAIAALQ